MLYRYDTGNAVMQSAESAERLWYREQSQEERPERFTARCAGGRVLEDLSGHGIMIMPAVAGIGMGPGY